MRFGTFYKSMEPATGDSVSDFDFDLAINSRVGVKGTTGALGGVVEMGFNVGNAVYTRLMYGTYKMASGTLLIGQDYSNNTLFSAQVDSADKGFNGYGSIDTGRQPQIKFTMNNGLYFAAIKATPAVTGNEIILPKLNVGYKGTAGNVSYNAGLLYQTYKIGENDGESVDSFMGYAGGKFTVGAASLQMNLGYGQNTGDMSVYRDVTHGSAASNKYVVASDDDTTSFEGYVQAGYKISDMVSLFAGVGYATDDSDAYANADDKMAFFVNAPITVAKGFTIVPEFSYYDQMENKTGADERTDYSVGAKLQMDF
jgi:hypothetical protein